MHRGSLKNIFYLVFNYAFQQPFFCQISTCFNGFMTEASYVCDVKLMNDLAN